MTAHELAKLLLAGPDLPVLHLWDGALRTAIEHVWVTRSGRYIATADYAEGCYRDDERPSDAPTEKDDPYWETPPNPNPPDDDYWD